MKFDLAKLMQERLAEINKINKKAFSEDSDHTLYLIKNIILNVKLKRSATLYIAFKSYEDLEKYVNDAHPLTTNESGVEFIGIRNPDEDISKIKDFANCSEGETVKLIEYGGERRFFMNTRSEHGKLKILIFDPKEIVNTYGPFSC